MLTTATECWNCGQSTVPFVYLGVLAMDTDHAPAPTAQCTECLATHTVTDEAAA